MNKYSCNKFIWENRKVPKCKSRLIFQSLYNIQILFCLWICGVIYTEILTAANHLTLDSKEIKPLNPQGNQPEYSLKGLTLKLKFQYFGHLMQKADSLENILILRKSEDRRRRGRQRMRWLDGVTDSMDMSVWVLVTQLCSTPYDPRDCSLPASFAHRTL